MCGRLPDDELRNVSGQAVGDEAEEGAVPHPVLNTVVEDRAPTCSKQGLGVTVPRVGCIIFAYKKKDSQTKFYADSDTTQYIL